MEEPGSDLWYWRVFRESKEGAGVSYLTFASIVVKAFFRLLSNTNFIGIRYTSTYFVKVNPKEIKIEVKKILWKIMQMMGCLKSK